MSDPTPRDPAPATPLDETRADSGPAAAGVPPRLGKYRLLRRLGQGGMGVVYEAHDTALHRRVAIKILPHAIAANRESVERFLVEARAAARLNHPHAVAIYDVARQDGQYFLAMELVSGENCQQRLARGPLPWREATRIAADACEALVAAHAAGVLHRDIKPANLLCAADGAVKLADFGLAKFTDAGQHSLTSPSLVVGTPHYMSPEQCQGEKLDPQSDVYSLGATYFALLAGRPPYTADSQMQVMFAHCSQATPEVRAARPEIPPECSAVIHRAMAKQKSDRYPTAAALLADLRRLLSAASAAPPPVRSFGPPPLPPPAAFPDPPAPPLVRAAPSATAARRPNGVSRRALWAAGGGAALAVAAGIALWRALASHDGWKSLLDERLAQWATMPGSRGGFEYQGGLLVGRGQDLYLLTTRDDFSDFELRAELQVNAQGNSGLFLRCTDDAGLPHGYEVQLGERLGTLNRIGMSAGPSSVAPELVRFEGDAWLFVEVVLRGSRITVRIDGREVLNYDDPGGPRRGRLGLQVFDAATELRVRRLELRETRGPPAQP